MLLPRISSSLLISTVYSLVSQCISLTNCLSNPTPQLDDDGADGQKEPYRCVCCKLHVLNYKFRNPELFEVISVKQTTYFCEES